MFIEIGRVMLSLFKFQISKFSPLPMHYRYKGLFQFSRQLCMYMYKETSRKVWLFFFLTLNVTHKLKQVWPRRRKKIFSLFHHERKRKRKRKELLARHLKFKFKFGLLASQENDFKELGAAMQSRNSPT